MAATTFLTAEARLQELRRVEIEMRDLRKRMDVLEHTKAVLLELEADEAPRRSVPKGAGLRAIIMGGFGPQKAPALRLKDAPGKGRIRPLNTSVGL